MGEVNVRFLLGSAGSASACRVEALSPRFPEEGEGRRLALHVERYTECTAMASQRQPRRTTDGRPNPGPPAAFAIPDDTALLAMMVARSAPPSSAHRIAAQLFHRFGNLAAILSADAPELGRIEGVGAAVLTDLKMLRLLCERLARSEAARRPVVSSWSALLAYVRVALVEEPREQFRALFLDRKNQLLRDELVSSGTVDHAPVYPREVVRRALELSASAVILVHNHPSGDPQPSRADIEMTRKVVDAARVVDIQVHDHLIVGRGGTASFRALGLF